MSGGRLVGKMALVIGADAIAIGIATRYGREGADVTVAADPATLAAAALPDGARTVAIGLGDGDATALERAAGARLDILVLGGEDVPAADDWVPVSALTPERLSGAQDRLLRPALLALRACEAALKAAGDGSIIVLFAPGGWYSDGGWTDRTIAYHARHGLMRAVAAEWGPVRANMLVPFADTPGFRAFRERNPGEVDLRVRTTAFRRAGDPVTDIGGAAVFLGSDDTRYVNGMIVHADGGAHLTAPVIEAKMPVAS